MAYSDLAALQQRMPAQTLIDLTDDADAGAVDEEVVDRAIADADAEIDSYLVGRYAVPVDPVLPMVRLLSLNLSVEILYGRRPDLDLPEAAKTAAKNARALLARIAAKDAHLPGVAEADNSGSVSAGAVFSGSERMFTRESLKGM
jgi:phage gp36-like protein